MYKVAGSGVRAQRPDVIRPSSEKRPSPQGWGVVKTVWRPSLAERS